MLGVFSKTAAEMFGYLERPEILNMFVVRRPANEEEDGLLKYGVHVKWPDLIINQSTMVDFRSVSPVYTCLHPTIFVGHGNHQFRK